MSIVGIGVDIEVISRFGESDHSNRLVERIFTEAEVGYCRTQAVPARHFAARFAAKEATVKALNTVLPKLLVTQVEVYKIDGSPAPLLRLIAGAELPEGIGLQVSLSHSGENAIAFVVAERL